MTEKSSVFNLSTDPWIGVIRSDGSFSTVGFKELLSDAHRIRSIETGWLASDNAVMDYSLAIAYRALDTAVGTFDTATSKIGRYFAEGSMSAEIDSYLTKHHDSFRLDRFGQVQDIVISKGDGKEETRNLSRLFANLIAPADANQNPRPGRITTIASVDQASPAEVALALVTTLRYDIPKRGVLAMERSALAAKRRADEEREAKARASGERVKKTKEDGQTGSMGGQGLGAYSRLVLAGKNLAETIILNMPPQSTEEKARDFAAWEVPDAETRLWARLHTPISGRADWLTFQSRAILLGWEDGAPVSVIVAANNFATNRRPGLTGKDSDGLPKGEAPYSRTEQFLRLSPYGVWRKSEKADPVDFSPPNESRGTWFGIRAFVAHGGEGGINHGANLPWAAKLEAAGLIPRSAPLSVEYSGVVFGKNKSYVKSVVSENYQMRSWLSSEEAREHRDIVDLAFKRVSSFSFKMRLLEDELRTPASSGESNRPSSKSGVDSQASGLESTFVSLAVPSLHRLVASIQPGESAEAVARRFVSTLRADVITSFDGFDRRFSPERLGADRAAAVIERRKREIMDAIEGTKSESEKEAWTPPRRDAPEAAVKARAGSIIARARRNTGVRVALASLNGQPIERHPQSAIEVLAPWGSTLPESTWDAADQALADACSLWAKSSDSAGPSSFIRVASRLARLERQSKREAEGFVQKSMRRILSTGDAKSTIYAVDSLIRYFVSRGERVNFADLAADLYLLRTEPTKARYRWAKLYATGRA